MVDWVVLIQRIHTACQASNVYADFLPIHNTEIRVCSRYNRTRPKKDNLVYTHLVHNYAEQLDILASYTISRFADTFKSYYSQC